MDMLEELMRENLNLINHYTLMKLKPRLYGYLENKDCIKSILDSMYSLYKSGDPKNKLITDTLLEFYEVNRLKYYIENHLTEVLMLNLIDDLED